MSSRKHARLSAASVVAGLVLGGVVWVGAPAPALQPLTAYAETPSPSPTASSSYTVRADWAASVLTRMNQQRAAHGVPALTSNAKLVSAAQTHNLAMASANTLSHQLPGEPKFSARITNAGYTWRACAENIAYNSNRSEAGVLASQDAMYNEVPPNDGHRRNILNATFTEVGISVVEDTAHNRVWLTSDFGKPA